jgi:methylenetetrahydrofolate reductase (NADPH)
LTDAADSAARKEIGISWATGLVKELVSRGAPGIHLYAFNEHKNVTEVLRRAGLVQNLSVLESGS